MTDPNANALTDSERAELENLRRMAQSQPPVTPVTPAENAVTLPPTHWLHLANGEVITSNGVKSIHDNIPVIASYEIPPELANTATDNVHVF